jgi:hypothetical protein
MAVELIEKHWDDLLLTEDERKVEAAETVTFVYEGREYSIDMTTEHAVEYHQYMSRLVSAGRVVVRKRAAAQSKGRGRNSPRSDYLRGLREYFASIGEPLQSYSSGRDNKAQGYKYNGSHYKRYDEHLEQQARLRQASKEKVA